MAHKVAVTYLNRSAEGVAPVENFIRSYKKADPGMDHEFITIYKGFAPVEMEASRRLFENMEDRWVSVDDDMTDIDAYLIAAEKFSDIDVFCFLNTFSEINCNQWLYFLHDALAKDGVGITGASASYESLFNSYKLISKAVWLCSQGALKYNYRLYLHYKTIFDEHAAFWLQQKSARRFIYSYLPNYAPRIKYHDKYNTLFEEYWKELTAANGVFSFIEGYPPFPNPSIRTNCFMVRRKHLACFLNNNFRMTKNQSYLFESGPEGLTSSILNKGLRAVIVNSDGNVYDVEQWPQSETFRLGKQEKLMVADNQTKGFVGMNPLQRNVLAYMTWGSALGDAPAYVSVFGIPFDVAWK
ncbi:MAG: hypothetical protein KKB57_13965 [Proteobacteria bacterium]|nr:hypothetical protein [Pseudomonadota bacterium]